MDTRHVDPSAPDLEAIDLGGDPDRTRTRPGRLASRRRVVALVLSIVLVAIVGSLAAMRPRHHRRGATNPVAARTAASSRPTNPQSSPVRSSEPILGRFYPVPDRTHTTTIILPTGVSVSLSGDMTKEIAGLGATFGGTVTPKNTAACCALSFSIEHAAPSDLFATLGPSPISTPVLVPATKAVQPNLKQVAGRFGILSTGDWTLIASFENGDHTTVADATVVRMLDLWHLRSTTNGPVLDTPANSTIDNSEADFGRVPDLSATSVDLIQTACPALIGTTPTTFGGTPADTVGAWCEHGLLVRIEGPRSSLRNLLASLKVTVTPRK